MISSAQIRGARGMLDWSMVQLAAAARVSVSAIKRIETVGTPIVPQEVASVLRATLEREGIVFVEDDGRGDGVRLLRRTA